MTLTQINSTAIRDIQFETLRPKPQEMQVSLAQGLSGIVPISYTMKLFWAGNTDLSYFVIVFYIVSRILALLIGVSE